MLERSRVEAKQEVALTDGRHVREEARILPLDTTHGLVDRHLRAGGAGSVLVHGLEDGCEFEYSRLRGWLDVKLTYVAAGQILHARQATGRHHL